MNALIKSVQFFLIVFCITIFGCAGNAPKVDGMRTIKIRLSTNGNDVSFDQNAIQVPAYKPFRLAFHNNAEMKSEITHNVAIIKRGQEQQVMDILNKEEYEYSETVNFFKNEEYFIGVSKIIEPQHHGAILIPGLDPGFYTYICLMPGHGNILNMKGKLFARVKKDKSSQQRFELEELKEEFIRPNKIPYVRGNRFTKKRYMLGKTLFFDPLLSKNNTISCATCHIPEKQFEDGKVKSIGINGSQLKRTTPSILNLAWAEPLMWDGRSPDLQHQALIPITATDEMALEANELIKRLNSNKNYIELFKEAYGKKPSKNLVGKAIAIFERNIVSSKSRFDHWVENKEFSLSEKEKQGFLLFNNKANCASCHSGWRFTDDSFHDIGVDSKDLGRGDHLKSLVKMKFAFKTPSLRNIVQNAPYFHNGSMKSIEDILEFYNRGGDIKRDSLSDEIKPLHLSQEEKDQLLAFLNTLTSKINTDGL